MCRILLLRLYVAALQLLLICMFVYMYVWICAHQYKYVVHCSEFRCGGIATPPDMYVCMHVCNIFICVYLCIMYTYLSMYVCHGETWRAGVDIHTVDTRPSLFQFRNYFLVRFVPNKLPLPCADQMVLNDM